MNQSGEKEKANTGQLSCPVCAPSLLGPRAQERHKARLFYLAPPKPRVFGFSPGDPEGTVRDRSSHKGHPKGSGTLDQLASIQHGVPRRVRTGCGRTQGWAAPWQLREGAVKMLRSISLGSNPDSATVWPCDPRQWLHLSVSPSLPNGTGITVRLLHGCCGD